MPSNAIAFDTHRFVKRMTAAGMPEQQAEALAESQADLLNSNPVTKLELDKALAKIEAHLIKWMVGLTMGGVGVIVALFSFFLR